MEKKEKQGLHKVRIRKGDVVEKTADFERSVFSLLYEKAEKIIRDIVQNQEENGESGHLLSFMGERGSGKTTAMLSILRALGEGRTAEGGFLKDCKEARFVTFDVIDASMLEEEEDLFEIILAQMLVEFLKKCDRERSYEESWGEGRRDIRKELQKKFNDLLEGFRSLKRNKAENELTSLASLKNLSYSSRLRQNFQDLVKTYITYGQEPDSDSRLRIQTYLVFVIDDLDMNIDKGFEMLGQIHRYMLVPNVIIMIAAKYEQLEILGRKYFSRMVERLDKETEDWKIEYLNRTVKEYLEKMMPSYYRFYLPTLEEGAMGYGDVPIVEGEERQIKAAILGKIFRRIGVLFDGGRDGQHYLVPVSMRGLNDYYLFLDELVKLEPAGRTRRAADQERHKIQKDNLDKFQNDFVYRYMMERLNISDRQEISGLLRKQFPQWNTYLHRRLFQLQDMSWFGVNRIDRIDRNDVILLEMFKRDFQSFGNILLGIDWCVENARVSEEWRNCIIALYSLELNRKMWKEGSLDRRTFGGSVTGLWANRIFPQAVLLEEGMKRESLRYGGSVKGCRAGIGFVWSIKGNPEEDKLIEWLYAYKEEIRSIEVMALFFEAFHDNSAKNEKIRFESGFGTNKGYEVNGLPEGPVAISRIVNGSFDFNMLGFLTNLLEYESFYRELHEAFLQSWLAFLQVEDRVSLEKILKEFRKKEGLSLYSQMEAWYRETRGMALPYQHTDIYADLLAELRQWSMQNISERLSESSAWELLRKVTAQMEILLEEKECFFRETGGYDANLVRYFQECPVIKCIKDHKAMGLASNFPEKFGEIFRLCRVRNDYEMLYDPESEIDTSEDGNEGDML